MHAVQIVIVLYAVQRTLCYVWEWLYALREFALMLMMIDW